MDVEYFFTFIYGKRSLTGQDRKMALKFVKVPSPFTVLGRGSELDLFQRANDTEDYTRGYAFLFTIFGKLAQNFLAAIQPKKIYRFKHVDTSLINLLFQHYKAKVRTDSLQ